MLLTNTHINSKIIHKIHYHISEYKYTILISVSTKQVTHVTMFHLPYRALKKRCDQIQLYLL